MWETAKTPTRAPLFLTRACVCFVDECCVAMVWSWRVMRTSLLRATGAGECGKSTIFKQIQIHNTEGFKDEDYAAWRIRMYAKFVEVTQHCLRLCETPVQENVSGIDRTALTSWDACLASQADLKALWAEDGVVRKTAQQRASQGDSVFDDSVNHLVASTERLTDPGFTPTQDDILQFRFPTADISVVTYPVPDNPNVILRFVDVGGQRPERVKWNQLGTGVDFVIYVSALDDYDKTLVEDATKNRLKESLMLYKVSQ